LVRGDYGKHGKERDSSVLEVQQMRNDAEAIIDEFGNDELLEELSILVRRDCGNPANTKDTSILEVQHLGIDRKAIEEELEDDSMLEEVSNLVRRDGGKTRKREILQYSQSNTWERMERP
jgi:hypothetical protein